MVRVFYAKIDFNVFEESFLEYMSSIPEAMQIQCNKYINKVDRYRYLASKLLLKIALEYSSLNAGTLKDIKLSNIYNRPYIPNLESDFNISHSGNYAICILGKNARVGIDIEEIKYIDIAAFKPYFSIIEWEHINNASDKYHEFYRMWTRKESVIKADGRGLSILKRVFMESNICILDDTIWKSNEIVIDKDYISHYAIDSLNCNPIIIQVNL